MSSVPAPRPRRDLSVAEIVAQASSIMAAEGESAVTMRRVADACGVTAMAIYHHVGNKEELLTLVVDDVIGKGLASAPQASDWRSAMIGFASTYRAVLLANHGAAAVFLRRPVVSKNLARTTELLFEILGRGGIDGDRAAEAVDAIVLLMMGSIANDLTRPPDIRRGLIKYLPAEETPLLSERIEAYADRDGDERLRVALSWLLDGIEGTKPGFDS